MSDKPFNAPSTTLKPEQAVAYAAGRANGVHTIGPRHLRILEENFLKPDASNPRDRHDDWE